jgi:hypothetical protein
VWSVDAVWSSGHSDVPSHPSTAPGQGILPWTSLLRQREDGLHAWREAMCLHRCLMLFKTQIVCARVPCHLECQGPHAYCISLPFDTRSRARAAGLQRCVLRFLTNKDEPCLNVCWFLKINIYWILSFCLFSFISSWACLWWICDLKKNVHVKIMIIIIKHGKNANLNQTQIQNHIDVILNL